MRLRFFPLAAPLFLFLLASCGGSGSSDGSNSGITGSLPTPTVTPSPTPASTPEATPIPTQLPTETPLIGDLDPSLPPSENFDLSTWYVSIPTDDDNSGTADSIWENELNDGYENDTYFYTGPDGGMVFRNPVLGYKTSQNTSYTRVELREMLRAGDTSIRTQGVNGNNWVFSSAPMEDQTDAAAVDGTLTATLAVNHVTTTGDQNQVGRVIIGQIHANDDEPIRLYYRKLPDNEKGSIYFAHEPRPQPGNDNPPDEYIEMIGTRSQSAPDPEDGIALNEVFSYEINVVGNTLRVKILREGKADIDAEYNMADSRYDEGGQYMYFKAGAYIQDNTGEPDDYVQVTFYALEATHD